MNELDQRTYDCTVASYLGERTQKVRIVRETNAGWYAESTILAASAGQELSESKLEALDDAADRHPGLAFRLADGFLQAYVPLAGDYGDLPIKSVFEELRDVDTKLIEYLGHAADRLEFELTQGEDRE